MKLPKILTRKKKLRASTARRSMNLPDEMDYEEMSEPNMKLSRALLIVLVLHVVAVAGIIAFNTIKSRQAALPQGTRAAVERADAAAAPSENAGATVPSLTSNVRGAAKSSATSRDDRETEPARALPVSNSAPEGKTYVVAKGDNPVSIARKFKVSESELLSLNHIDDPRKLQIGQKLIVPSAKKSKK